MLQVSERAWEGAMATTLEGLSARSTRRVKAGPVKRAKPERPRSFVPPPAPGTVPKTHKGRPPPRKCPDDFDVVFVERGRTECEAWYRARRTTVSRWLEERGKQRLLGLRRAFVRHQRDQRIPLSMSSAAVDRMQAPAKPKLVASPEPLLDRRPVDPELARLAADHLRVQRHGGWIVSPTRQGDWWVGSRRRSAGELVALAVSKGFDVAAANLQVEAARGVGVG